MSKVKDIYVTRPSMPVYEEYCQAIKPLWDSHWLTNMGKYHQELEKRLKDYLDVPEVSLTVNGHMALELALQLFDFPEGSEVITTPFTFISTTHAIVRNRLQPVFCDVKESDGTIDEARIETLITPKTVAILPVHVYGNVCNVEAIQAVAHKYGLKVIYDAAHSFGERVRSVGKCVEAAKRNVGAKATEGWTGIGNFGDASIFSFHATKVYNTIEGGAVVCKNRDIYDRLYNLKNFGIRGEELVVSVGANAKMNEFASIMGLLNLKHLPETIADRKRVYEIYAERLSDVGGIRILREGSWSGDGNTKFNYAYVPIVLESDYLLSRDELYERFNENGIHVRKYFYPLTADQACFKNRYRYVELPVARKLSGQVLVLPMYEGMTSEEIERVVECIRKA